jgi:hypothetical protein
MRGLVGRERCGAQYAMTEAEWEEARERAVGYGSSELEQRQRAAKAGLAANAVRVFPSYEQIVQHEDTMAHGLGAGVAGDFA